MPEPKKEEVKSPPSPPASAVAGMKPGHTPQSGVPVQPAGPPIAPGPHAPGSPHRLAGPDVEAAATRVGGDPGHDLLREALANLEQRTLDRLPEDQKAGSRGEFQSFRDQVVAIYGSPE